MSKRGAEEWELVNPEGAEKVAPMNVNPHPRSLVGKTVVLRTNGKHNSDRFLDRVAERLEMEVKDIRIVRLWQVAPETNTSSQNPEESKWFTDKIASFKPDLVISAQCD